MKEAQMSQEIPHDILFKFLPASTVPHSFPIWTSTTQHDDGDGVVLPVFIAVRSNFKSSFPVLCQQVLLELIIRKFYNTTLTRTGNEKNENPRWYWTL